MGESTIADRRLLACGAVAGPVFILTVLVQDFTRPGFDPRIHLLSQLSLGPLGWVQVANFVLAGVLYLFGAIGLSRREHGHRGGTAAPVLLSLFGMFLILVGVFRTDPAHGFPPGAPAPQQPTVSGIIHSAGALPTFLCLGIAIVMLSRVHSARGDRGISSYLLISAIVFLFMFIGAMAIPTFTGPVLQLAVLVGWSAPSVSALRLLRQGASPTPPLPLARPQE
jgi:hypothetical membrane protein